MADERGIARWQVRARRALRRPPGEILRRAVFEAKTWIDRGKGVPSARYSDAAFARLFGAPDIDPLWEVLQKRPYPVAPAPSDSAGIRAAAARARRLEVDLLGSGPITIGAAPRDIDWHRDFKSGHRWPLEHFRDLDLNDLGRPSDVKVPWELSRMQWLIPVGQDFLLNGDPAHARFVREVLESWIIANPYARGPNWGVAMEAAMRIFTWTWLFHAFAASDEWRALAFRGSFLRSIYDHAIFCARYMEDFGTSTNHLIADAAGVAEAGLFLGSQALAGYGFGALYRALLRQLTADGLSHEGSAAYHRFVSDLVRVPLLHAKALGLTDLGAVEDRLALMDEVTAALTGPDGRLPAWGDADDGRVLPPLAPALAPLAASRAFPASGLFIMASARDHVSVFCGPLGHAHGHNDALSFEAVLDGVRLITDSGSYVYTSAPAERNVFRSAAAHNAPIVDGAEPNPIIEGELFLLRDRAKASLVDWQTSDELDRFTGTHRGYVARPTRTLILDKTRHRLSLRDDFTGSGEHTITVRLHFAAGATLAAGGPGRWHVEAGGKTFEVALGTPDWAARTALSWESPRYGVKIERSVLELTRTGAPAPLSLEIYPL